MRAISTPPQRTEHDRQQSEGARLLLPLNRKDLRPPDRRMTDPHPRAPAGQTHGAGQVPQGGTRHAPRPRQCASGGDFGRGVNAFFVIRPGEFRCFEPIACLVQFSSAFSVAVNRPAQKRALSTAAWSLRFARLVFGLLHPVVELRTHRSLSLRRVYSRST